MVAGGAQERVPGPKGIPVTSTAEDTVCVSCPTLLGPKAPRAPTLLCVAPPRESQHFTFSSVPPCTQHTVALCLNKQMNVKEIVRDISNPGMNLLNQ